MTLALYLLSINVVSFGQARYEPVSDPGSPAAIPYTRYFTRDALDRRITFYVSGSPDDNRRLPLIVFILGSGAHSNFIERRGKILDAHRILREETGGRVRILAIEKPGVAFLSQPAKNGTAIGASPEFLEEQTAGRWSEAVNAAIRATEGLGTVDKNKLLVVGHSEGSRVAASVASNNSSVTHFAGLSGFATSRLRCFMIGRDGSGTRAKADEAVQQWRRMLAAPGSLDLFSGHTFRYWVSFSTMSTLHNLLESKAALYLAQGTVDEKCAVDGYELLYAQLVECGRTPTTQLIEGADHGFAFRDQPERDGWREQLRTVVDWFLS
ncbi:MAG: hypothetical protein O2968_06940 [Acidobacteria bacterium]|nr:hypothetical protein [Acidobacteriota bacterium]